jgi:hypothetical protein
VTEVDPTPVAVIICGRGWAREGVNILGGRKGIDIWEILGERVREDQFLGQREKSDG